MICEECGQDRPCTYRSSELGKRAVCGPCIRANHPDTLIQNLIGCSLSKLPWSSPIYAAAESVIRWMHERPKMTKPYIEFLNTVDNEVVDAIDVLEVLERLNIVYVWGDSYDCYVALR